MARRSGRSNSAARTRSRSQTRTAIIQIAVVAIIVILVAVVYFKVMESHRDLDTATLCPSDPVAVTVLLVDMTDPMNVAQRQDFANQLARLKNSIPRYGKLIVAKVDATSSSLLTPVIVRCNPGTAADVDPATGDPAGVQKQWEQGFDKPLQAAFQQLASASGAETSPIVESVQSIALTEFQRPGLEGKPKKLVLASDLLQNTPEISFYRSLPDADDFTSSAPFRKARTDLRGVDVELWMLERTDASSTQPRKLADLWDRIITAQGGNVLRVYNVSG